MPVDGKLTRELLRELVAIDSVNPSLVPEARGEAAAAGFLRDWLARQGIDARLQEGAQIGPSGGPGLAPASPRGRELLSRPNVVALLGSQGTGKKERVGLLMVAHVDTVGAGGMAEPFTPRERDGRLYGRGAMDIKSGVAAMCVAAVAVVREGLRLKKPLLVAAVVDEECNSIGTQALAREYEADAAVVLEPTGLKLCIAHKGYAWFEVVTRGRAAHGSLPEEGRDAIRMMGRVLDRLEALERRLIQLPPHPLLGHASLHASLISGGQELSSYPAECRLELERRTLPGESDAQVEAELRALLEELGAADPEFGATARRMASRAPYEIARDAPITLAAAEAIERVTGAVELCGMPFWTDTALLAAAGIPGVVFGPRGWGMHGSEECVELDSVLACAEVLRVLMEKVCNGV